MEQQQQQRHPYRRLLSVFAAWKGLLLCVALLTPAPAYDTSTTLVLPPPLDTATTTATAASAPEWPLLLLRRLCEKLTRWDAIYFTKLAERGYEHEQEWAFGQGYVGAVAALAGGFQTVFPALGRLDPPLPQAAAGILLSNTAHLLSAFLLHELTRRVFPRHPRVHTLSLLSATLHVLSPAGLFLSAPYTEALFSLLTFAGALVFLRSQHLFLRHKTAKACLATVVASVWFAASAVVRSNGVLNGALFLGDFLGGVGTGVARVVGGGGVGRRGIVGAREAARIGALGLGGVMIAAGVVAPQVLAWNEFCAPDEADAGERRPWCERTVPSIYGFVQSHYWDVGFLRYWKPANIPLFLLAAPMLSILTASALWGLGFDLGFLGRARGRGRAWTPAAVQAGPNSGFVQTLAAAQLALAVMALLSYHVQIITRISSGCVVWYWWLAALLMEGAGAATAGGTARGKQTEERVGRERRDAEQREKAHGNANGNGNGNGNGNVGPAVVRFMLLYALVQGVLFAAFLPPA